MIDGQTLTVHLLGGFRIMAGHDGVAGLNHARLQELLAYLLLHRQRPIARQHLAFLFWPDSTEEQARTNLRTLWHRLRRTLPDAGLDKTDGHGDTTAFLVLACQRPVQLAGCLCSSQGLHHVRVSLEAAGPAGRAGRSSWSPSG